MSARRAYYVTKSIVCAEAIGAYAAELDFGGKNLIPRHTVAIHYGGEIFGKDVRHPAATHAMAVRMGSRAGVETGVAAQKIELSHHAVLGKLTEHPEHGGARKAGIILPYLFVQFRSGWMVGKHERVVDYALLFCVAFVFHIDIIS